MEDHYNDTLLEVNYYSQYRDISNTINAHRSCGMTCIKMVLDYYKKETVPLEDLVSKYIMDETAYGASGWKHDFFVDFLKSFGLNAYRKEKMNADFGIEDIIDSLILHWCPVIVSVEQRLFDKKLFHMILLVGVRRDSDMNIVGFFYHDPGRLREETGANQYVELDIFLKYWRRMAIFTN